jgi:hypothetical protein
MKKLLTDLLVLILGLTMSSNLRADGTQPPGSGTSGDPYLVSTLDHLLWISTNSVSWGSYFKQTANIDATDTQNWNSGAGFSPIGNSTTKFTGSYDGQNYTINALYISRAATSYIGLFGESNNSTISNLGVTNANITGYDGVGVLIGDNIGNVNSCYATGTVSGQYYIGGLVGNHGSGSINNSYSSCDVTAGEYTSYSGGLTGATWSASSIDNCYSTGDVSGYTYFGGLTGFNLGGTVNNSYSTGAINIGVGGGDSVGGLMGYNSGTVNNSFWDTQTSGQSSSAAGTGKTTSEMKTLATFTDETTTGLTTAWDFVTNPNDDSANDDIWDMDLYGAINSGYPYLSWQDGSDQSLPVELTSFIAIAGHEEVMLKWTTESEIENLGFILERRVSRLEIGNSEPGIGEWVEIASYVTHSELQGQGSVTHRTEYSYTDNTVEVGRTYDYRLADVSYDGEKEYHSMTVLGITVTGVIPGKLVLHPAYPNPFNPVTTITFDLPEAEQVTVAIYDLTGREVSILTDGKYSAGSHAVVWDAGEYSSGIYIYRLTAGSFTATEKLVLVK